jgi:hypothetical protein
MIEPVETFTVGDLTVTIHYDTDPGDSPREWDTIGTIWAQHRRYGFSDEGAGDPFSFTLDDCRSWDEVAERIMREYPGAIVLRLYLYDHSGIRLSTGSFIGRAQHASWDSGQVGVVYALPERIRETQLCQRIGPKIRERATAGIIGEIETYDQYVSGQVYGYTIERPTRDTLTGEEIGMTELDSLWGCYGLDDTREEARAEAERLLAEDVAA